MIPVVFAGHAGRGRREMRQSLLRAFRAAGALSPDRARTLEQLGLVESDVFRTYRNNRIVREVRSGEFYLDEDAAKEYEAKILRWALVPVAVLAAMLLFAIARGK
jgi:hypothetical protein